MEFAPARKHKLTASRLKELRPALKRTIEAGMSRRAVAIVRARTRESTGSASARGVPLHRDQHIDGHTFGVRLEIRQLMQQANPIFVGFAHADDAAATNSNSRAPHSLNGAQPVLVAARADDAAVELGRSIQIVVIGGETRGGQTARLIVGQHAEGAADFELQRGYSSHHLEHRVEVAPVPHFAPCGTHAEAAGAFIAGLFCRSADLLDIHQRLILNSRLVMSALRAIAAVFRAPTGFNRKQTTKLDASWIVEFPMDLLRVENQIEQRPMVDLPDGVASPIVTQSGVRADLTDRVGNR